MARVLIFDGKKNSLVSTSSTTTTTLNQESELFGFKLYASYPTIAIAHADSLFAMIWTSSNNYGLDFILQTKCKINLLIARDLELLIKKCNVTLAHDSKVNFTFLYH